MELSRRLMTTFLGELGDHVRALNRDLLEFEKATDEAVRQPILATLFRTAHSLKGASRSVNVVALEAVCHRMEAILADVRDGVMAATPTVLHALFHATDGIQDAGNRLQAGQSLDGSPIHAVLAELEAAAAGRGVPPVRTAPAAPVPAAPAAPGTAPGGGVVRIDPGKLDALFTWGGETLVARRRMDGHDEELSVLRESVEHCRARWERGRRTFLGTAASRGGSGGRTLRTPGTPDRVGEWLDGTGEDLRLLERDLGRIMSGFSAHRRAMERAGTALEKGIREVRMLPFSEACEGLARAARDLAASRGREADLVVEGGAVEMDRAILERLKDPLLHLVRNAVDHGLEAPAERLRAGKPRRGRVRVAAALRGDSVEVVLEDDGRGVDLATVRAAARRKRMAEPEGERDLARLILLPGFSTAPMVTEVSGRGIGLDIVRKAIESVHGTLDFSTEEGKGTRFELLVPLTLTTVRVLFLSTASRTFAVVGSSIRSLLRAGPEQIRSVGGRDAVLVAGEAVPLSDLAAVLGLRPAEPHHAGKKVPVVVLASGSRSHAFVVDDLLAEREVLVKNLGPRLVRVRHFTGATLLPTGGVALILNAADLARSALERAGPGAGGAAPANPAEKARRRILLAEDSVTTRTLEKGILEAAGYEVMAVPDGAAAWQILQEHGADLIVSDVEMPRMDGFGLTEAIRGSDRFRYLPVVLVTSLASERDRARGVAAGANAYLVKSAFEQRALVETVGRLL